MAKSKLKTPGPEEFAASFRKGQFQPVYLFCGEEDFLSEECVNLLVSTALDEATRSFNLTVVYGSEVTGADIIALASSFPMMGERRVVIVREFDRVSGKEALTSYLERPCPSTLLVLLCGKPDFRNTVFKTLKDQATIGEFRQLYDNEIPGWILDRIRGMGKTMTAEAAQLIHAYVGRSLREITKELEKLCTYVGPKPVIDADDVANVVGLSRQFSIFELQRAIGRQQRAQAIGILERMLKSGESPLGIIIMLTRYFQKLWLLQELLPRKGSGFQIAASIGVSPAFVEEYVDGARRYSSLRLGQCFQSLADADEALKSSSLDQRVVMTVLLFGLFEIENPPFPPVEPSAAQP